MREKGKWPVYRYIKENLTRKGFWPVDTTKQQNELPPQKIENQKGLNKIL